MVPPLPHGVVGDSSGRHNGQPASPYSLQAPTDHGRPCSASAIQHLQAAGGGWRIRYGKPGNLKWEGQQDKISSSVGFILKV